MKILGQEVPKVLGDALADCRRHFMAAAIFSLLINILYLAPTIYMLQVYDRVVPTGGVATLGFITLALAIALLTLSSLDAIRLRLLVRASLKLDSLVTPRLMQKAIGSGAPAAQAIRFSSCARVVSLSGQRM